MHDTPTHLQPQKFSASVEECKSCSVEEYKSCSVKEIKSCSVKEIKSWDRAVPDDGPVSKGLIQANRLGL